MSEGVKHDQDKIRFDLIPVEAIEALAKVLKMGAEKYGDNNWREGIKYHRVYRAAQHHLQEFWGEYPDKDEESGLPHLYHALCNIAFLITYEENKERYRTFDDRAGSNNKYFKKSEKDVNILLDMIKDNPEFFDSKWAGTGLDAVINILDIAIQKQNTVIAPFPDLTKMTHPEACEHLEVGMKVKILCKHVPNERKKWTAGWPNEMDEFVGRTLTIFLVNKNLNYGVSFVEDGMKWDFPAFVLEIVSRPSKEASVVEEIPDSSCTKHWKER